LVVLLFFLLCFIFYIKIVDGLNAGHLSQLKIEVGDRTFNKLIKTKALLILDKDNKLAEELKAACEREGVPDLMAKVAENQLSQSPESRIIIFATFRDMVQQIVDFLCSRGIPAERFIGQAARDTERGLSQKQQIDILDRFKAGRFRVLVATSVGEEGLDVPSTDMVIFTKPSPQRYGVSSGKGGPGGPRFF
jgi:ERCC4-related helicase